MFNELYIMNIMNIILFIICMNRPKSKLNKEDIRAQIRPSHKWRGARALQYTRGLISLTNEKENNRRGRTGGVHTSLDTSVNTLRLEEQMFSHLQATLSHIYCNNKPFKAQILRSLSCILSIKTTQMYVCLCFKTPQFEQSAIF